MKFKLGCQLDYDISSYSTLIFNKRVSAEILPIWELLSKDTMSDALIASNLFIDRIDRSRLANNGSQTDNSTIECLLS